MDTEEEWQHCNSETFWREVAPRAHVVQLYESEEGLLNLLEDFAAGGVTAGDAVIVIATGEHLEALGERLGNYGLDIDSLRASGQYLPLDVGQIMAGFMVGGWPDERLFVEAVTGIFDRVRGGGWHVRAFGEMVALLWARGSRDATVRLEHLWNAFSEREAFSLFCAYPREAFCEDAAGALSSICGAHSRMISNAGEQRFDLAYRDVQQAWHMEVNSPDTEVPGLCHRRQ